MNSLCFPRAIVATVGGALMMAVLSGCDRSGPLSPSEASAAAPRAHAPAPTIAATPAPADAVKPTVETTTVAESSADEAAFQGLSSLMETGLHEPFTVISFHVWHEKNLGEAGYKEVADAARKVQDTAKQISRFKRNRWTSSETAFFEEKALQLEDLAGYLAGAADRQDKDHVIHYVMSLESTCQKCHAKFAPDLSF
jgi:hypothetical protein